jgi:hypothetical protein
MIAESLLVLAIAATPGIPEVPIYVAPHENVWLGIQNDIFCLARPSDEFRTYGFNAGILHNNWLVTANYSALTGYYMEDRIDVITGLVGYRFEIELERDCLSITPAVGYLLKGDWAGERGQNAFHRAINAQAGWNVPYEDDEDSPFASVMVSIDGSHNDYYHRFAMGYQRTIDENHFVGMVMFGDHHVDCFDMYVGVRMEFHTGFDTLTEQATADHENGMALMYSISFNHVHFLTSYNPSKDYGSGEIVYTF